MNASSLLNIKGKPKVHVAKSHIKNGGNGLFASSYFTKNVPMVIYYGHLLTHQQVYDIYMDHQEIYYQMSDDLRGTSGNNVILGDRNNTNPNLLGVYVNDISFINCPKNEINRNILSKYAQTHQVCNLKVVDTPDYPVYVTTCRVKKDEELYVHYGIGYWLTHIGCTPDEISTLNDYYDYESLYI
jgi:hypothetical protein